jgi:RNA polymerase sigma-70 factor (ECF subfamily)
MSHDARLLLLRQARRGDLQARGELLDGFRPYLRAIVETRRSALGSVRLDSSDVIQDVLLAAHRNFDQFRGGSMAELTAWLRQVALHTAGKAVRNQSAARRTPAAEVTFNVDALAADTSTPSGQASDHEEAARLAAALERLPEDMSAVIRGRHVEQASYALLAERLGRSEEAVRALYTRALRRLRELCGIDGRLP